MNSKNKISVLGATGMLGGAIARRLENNGYINIQKISRSTGVNFLNKDEVNNYFKNEKPEFAFMVAGKVGGILANNTYQADFLYENAMMILNVLEAVKEHSPETKILYTGSTCIYPKENPQPINENRFMMGPLEETNKGYAVAKGMGVVAGQLYRKQYGMNFISAMPTNLYGIGDNYDLQNSHFIAAMIIKFINNKKDGTPLVFWGSGRPRREALYADDCADACIYLMNNYEGEEIVNIGTGFDNSIKEYVEIGKRVFDYKGDIEWDTTKPDGMYEKRTDITNLLSIMPDYKPRPFEEGLKEVLKKDFNYTF